MMIRPVSREHIMSSQSNMWPFNLFAPNNLAQSILPGWSFGNVTVNYAGDADIEKKVVEDVASFGRQIGIISDVVLELANGKPAATGEPLAQLRDIAAKVKEIKERHKRSLSEKASAAMAKLAESDTEEAQRIARQYTSKT
jgi:hypothetical protein